MTLFGMPALFWWKKYILLIQNMLIVYYITILSNKNVFEISKNSLLYNYSVAIKMNSTQIALGDIKGHVKLLILIIVVSHSLS